jgi:hypothetical protein
MPQTTPATDAAARRPGELRDDVHLLHGWQAPISTLQRDRKRRSNLESLSYRRDGAIIKAAAIA